MAETERGVGSARLHDLFVVPRWRRRGVASALFGQVGQWAEALPEYSCLEWRSSPAGLAFYEQMGPVGNEADDSATYPFFEIKARRDR
ncbi:GNAT family N-acetyltransferase [Streptomyces sp. NPDC051569]|uniref:GNAT family N-acetyltransferase n=1 Tax=Streptomyces sp. NPDC051569 TaxID=3365661 RepID=UPI003793706A